MKKHNRRENSDKENDSSYSYYALGGLSIAAAAAVATVSYFKGDESEQRTSSNAHQANNSIASLTGTTSHASSSHASSSNAPSQRPLADNAPNQDTSAGTGEREVISSASTTHKRSFPLRPLGKRWFELVTRDFPDGTKPPRKLSNSAQLPTSVKLVLIREREESGIPSSDDSYLQVGTVSALNILAESVLSEEMRDQIHKDLPRTCPDVSYFADPQVRNSLERILVALALEFDFIGYVQGQNFLVANLILHTKSEDNVLAIIRAMMSNPKYGLQWIFAPGFPKLIRFSALLDTLLREHFPAVHAHFETIGLQTVFFANTWFMTLFSYTMDYSDLAKVWDLFFTHGWPGFFAVCMVLISHISNEVAYVPFEKAVVMLKGISTSPPRNFEVRAQQFEFSEQEKAAILQAAHCDETDESSSPPPLPYSATSASQTPSQLTETGTIPGAVPQNELSTSSYLSKFLSLFSIEGPGTEAGTEAEMFADTDADGFPTPTPNRPRRVTASSLTGLE